MLQLKLYSALIIVSIFIFLRYIGSLLIILIAQLLHPLKIVCSFLKTFEDSAANPLLFTTTEMFRIEVKKSKNWRAALISASYIAFTLPIFGFSALHLVFKSQVEH